MVAVIGKVGSRKLLLLSAILGEMEPIQGSKVYIPHPENQKDNDRLVSYCAQSPWVVNDTLRGNILFGREFNQERDDKIMGACALLDDIAILPAGDMTELGERGINLSVAKRLVSLWQALYTPRKLV